MKLLTRIYVYTSIAIVAVAGIGVAWWIHDQPHVQSPLAKVSPTNSALKSISTYVAHPNPNAPVVRYMLVAEAKTLQLGQGKTVQAMTFNGTAPGPTLTVDQGDYVEVTVKNKLNVPITVHWHGLTYPERKMESPD